VEQADKVWWSISQRACTSATVRPHSTYTATRVQEVLQRMVELTTGQCMQDIAFDMHMFLKDSFLAQQQL